MDRTRWQLRLDDLAGRHQVPGASLTVLADGEMTELATGVLRVGYSAPVTTDSLFQIGSITKVYTATVLMRLAGQGRPLWTHRWPRCCPASGSPTRTSLRG